MPQVTIKLDDSLFAAVGATSSADFEAGLKAFLAAQPGKVDAARAEGVSTTTASFAAQLSAIAARIEAVEAKPAASVDMEAVKTSAKAEAALKVAELLAANGGKPLAAAKTESTDAPMKDFTALVDEKAVELKSRAAASAWVIKNHPEAFHAHQVKAGIFSK